MEKVRTYIPVTTLSPLDIAFHLISQTTFIFGILSVNGQIRVHSTIFDKFNPCVMDNGFCCYNDSDTTESYDVSDYSVITGAWFPDGDIAGCSPEDLCPPTAPYVEHGELRINHKLSVTVFMECVQEQYDGAPVVTFGTFSLMFLIISITFTCHQLMESLYFQDTTRGVGSLWKRCVSIGRLNTPHHVDPEILVHQNDHRRVMTMYIFVIPIAFAFVFLNMCQTAITNSGVKPKLMSILYPWFLLCAFDACVNPLGALGYARCGSVSIRTRAFDKDAPVDGELEACTVNSHLPRFQESGLLSVWMADVTMCALHSGALSMMKKSFIVYHLTAVSLSFSLVRLVSVTCVSLNSHGYSITRDLLPDTSRRISAAV
mmetsp:Transcript_31271/g.60317  ORF Transcript_31271/g.60317 Transcript_31271/m.60317 type:complete len:373 (+) Transcript_31271:1355-2473(+)